MIEAWIFDSVNDCHLWLGSDSKGASPPGKNPQANGWTRIPDTDLLLQFLRACLTRDTRKSAHVTLKIFVTSNRDPILMGIAQQIRGFATGVQHASKGMIFINETIEETKHLKAPK